LNYTISKMKDHILIEVSGNIDRGNVMSAGSFIRELDIIYPETVILDVDGLEDEREMFYHVSLINTFKKEVEQAGGVLKIRATGLSIKKYLSITGLKNLFLFDETVMLAGAEV
jgi:hypothetical protein